MTRAPISVLSAVAPTGSDWRNTATRLPSPSAAMADCCWLLAVFSLIVNSVPTLAPAASKRCARIAVPSPSMATSLVDQDTTKPPSGRAAMEGSF